MKGYIIAIDQSTSASKVFLVDEGGVIVRRFSKEHQQFYPKAGYVEHDAEEIWQNVREGIDAVAEGVPSEELKALAISNQRETTVLWDRATGMPVCHAIVWQDIRGEALCERLRRHAQTVQDKTGLPLSAYYSAAKAASVLESDPAIRKMAKDGRLCIGTVDSYLVYRLTNGQSFRTDVSNASRTELCDIRTLTWDDELCHIFGIPKHCLPEIVSSDADFGQVAHMGLPITGVMGDSHAALFGQGCLSAGMAKATFGTGSSVMMNVGQQVIPSHNGLSASVGFGWQGKTCYVLEGNVTCSGDTLCWLRDDVEMVGDVSRIETIARTVESTEGVFLIPAFSGLGAPYFDGNARAALVGMSRSTKRAHIVRAALESMAYQDADVINAMEKDMGMPLNELRVDGGPTKNALLMQTLSDLLGCPVQCASQSELSALGSGYMAGLTVGLYSDFDAIPAAHEKGAAYQPTITDENRQSRMKEWHTAVKRCR